MARDGDGERESSEIVNERRLEEFEFIGFDVANQS